MPIPQDDARPSPLAGHWYPGDPGRLAASVRVYLDRASGPERGGCAVAGGGGGDRDPPPPAPPGAVCGLLAPHAGHRYSGAVAGAAFGSLGGRVPGRVVIISPMHHPASGRILTSGHAAYATPLGAVAVDREGTEALGRELVRRLGKDAEPVPVRDDPEHAVEIELPFLQVLAPEPGSFRLVPLMLRDQGRVMAEALGEALAAVFSPRDTLLVASSDLSHFYPQETALKLDRELLARLEKGDPAGVLAAEEEGVGFACGRGAIAAVLWACQRWGADQVSILQHGTSGDAGGGYERVVGYAAAAVWCSAVDR